MRVYGASPLYNYVELVFRSKRLFILSIILATAVVSVLATTRAKTYSATGIVILSQTLQAGIQNPDEVQMGSIRYKLNILNQVKKNPEFIKTALKDAELDRDSSGQTMSEVEFDKYTKDVMKALSVATDQTFLEISCRWKDDKAANIVKAFYAAYEREVLEQETALSTRQKGMLEKLLKDYTDEQKDMELKVVNYLKDHPSEPLVNPTEVASNVKSRIQSLEEQRFLLNMAQEQRNEVARQLQTTPKEVNTEIVRGNPAQTILDLPAAQKQRDDAKAKLEDLKGKYFDKHPQVVAAQKAFDDADAKVKELESKGSKLPNSSGPLKSYVMSRNPEWDRLNAELNQQDARIKAMTAGLSLQQQELASARQVASSAPKRNFDYKWMQINLDQISAIRANLANKVEMAILDNKRDEAMHSAEMKLLFPPESEQELTGAKSLMLYAAGPLLGIVIAFAFSLVAESLDHSLRTPVEVEKYLNKPVLAVLPRMDAPRKGQRQLGGADAARPSLPS